MPDGFDRQRRRVTVNSRDRRSGGQHFLADQLLVPLALARGGVFRATNALASHTHEP